MENQSKGAVVMAVGVGALNLVYLWDLLLGKTLMIGTWAWLGIVVANIVIVASLVMMVGGKGKSQGDGGGE